MQARARLFGHAIHQMLIPYPLALLTTAIAFDVAHLFTGNPLWATIAYWMIAIGIVGGLSAALFGFIDWTGIPSGTRAKRIGALHGIGNVVMVTLFAASWWLRHAAAGQTSTLALILAVAGATLSLLTGWLGGELVDRYGVAVEDGANVDGRPGATRPVHPVR